MRRTWKIGNDDDNAEWACLGDKQNEFFKFQSYKEALLLLIKQLKKLPRSVNLIMYSENEL